MFEMAAPIQSPAKCEVRSVIRFLNAKGERPAEIHKHIVAVYGNGMNRQIVKHLAGKKFDEDDGSARRINDVQRQGGRLL